MKTKQFLNVKTIVFLHLILFFGFGNLYSQTQLRGWSIAPNSVNFVPPPSPPPPSVLGLPNNDYLNDAPAFLTNSIADASGTPIFFVVDGVVYDKNGFRIDNFMEAGVLLNDFSQEISIVPVPGSCTLYYLIFGVRANLIGGGGITYYPVYTILDMSAQNINYPLDPTKRGALQYSVPGSTNVINLGVLTPYPSIFTEYSSHLTNHFGIAVTSLRSATSDHLMFIHGDNGMISFTINATGITYLAAPFGSSGVDPLGFDPPTGGSNNTNYTEMEVVLLSTGNYRVGKVFGNRYVCVADFSPTTSLLVTGTEKYIALPTSVSSSNDTEIVGLEFSQNGQKVYYSTTSPSILTSPIGFADLILSSPVPTPMNFSGVSNLDACQIEMGNDNKLYFNAGSQLYALNNPNATPSAINWVPSVLLPAGSGGLYSKLMPDQMDGNTYSGGAAGTFISTYTAGTFPYTALTQTWTPTNNPFGGTLLDSVGTASNPVIVLDKIIIPASFNITIKGMRIEFAGRTYDTIIPTLPLVAGASVQVLRSTTTGVKGGRLTLNGSTFTHTNSCRTGMWEGIEVEGSSTAFQGSYTTGKQGWLIVRNNSIVENAYHAVVMAKVNNTFNGVPGFGIMPTVFLSHSGGVVQVTTGSRFRNNYIDVYFGNYDHLPLSIDNNLSRFDNCTFETTPTTATTTTLFDLDTNLNVTSWFHHILIGVKGITYNGVTFQNTDTLNLEYDILLNKRGSGIFSFNSYYTVARRFAPPFNRGNFNYLTYGVYAANFGSIKTFNISECDFTDNYRGVYVGGVNYEKITQCNFKVNRRAITTTPLPDVSDSSAYGVYLNFSKGFRVEENDFTYASGTSLIANSFGVIVNNSNFKRVCGQHDEIYKNSFHNILAGARAQGNNSEQDVDPISGTDNFCYQLTDPTRKNYIGFEFLCNSFTSNVDNSDLSVTQSQNLATAGNVAYLQGDFSSSTFTPAGNTFSHTSSTTWDFYSQAFPDSVNGTIVYVHHNSDLLRTPNTFPVPPVNPAPCIGCGTYTADSSCPSKLDVRSPIMLRQVIVSFENKVATLEAKIDGGNTSYVLSQIYGSMSAGSLKNLLISKSPLLSDRVIIAYITKIGVPSGHIQQVLLANSPLTQPVMDALNSIGLPNGILNQINSAQTGISGRTKLESEISYYSSQRAFNIDELIRVFSNDTLLDYGGDSILTVLKTYNIEQNSTDITIAYLTKGDITKATLLNDSLKIAGTEESFTKMMDVAIALKQSTEQESKLLTDIALKTKVDELAALTDAKESPSANAVLRLLFNFIYNEYIEPVSWEASNHSMIQMVSAEEESSLSTNLYPNPSNGVSNFSYTLAEGETGVLQVFDIAGKLIQSYQLASDDNVININNTGLDAGTYMYKYIVNGNVSKTDKLVIIK